MIPILKVKNKNGEWVSIPAIKGDKAVRIILAQHLQAQSAYGLRLIIPLIGKKFKR